jgi:hypothetical protein
MRIEQPQNQANELDAEPVETAPATWKDIVRQHVTGPVFSLAFHIFLLVLLGTIVIIVPNSGKDDIDPVQITELEPVLPPPEEEPTPSDMTVMDTSSPSLDRYDSNDQQMEEVGVTDVAVMTDIEIPTPLTIPDSNSALKLQGVLPFGRKGGGDMGDGGEGDGRGNTKGMLQGVFYDLKQTRSRRTSEEFRDVPTAPPPPPPPNPGDPPRGPQKNWVLQRVPPTMEIMQSFVNGPWRREYDNQGKVFYPALEKYYCSPTRLWTSCFYTDSVIDAELAPKYYECDNVVKVPGAWVCIYSGNIVAPFSGKFRFLGAADDVILVRFNKEIVLDYGFASFTAGSYFYTSKWRDFSGEHKDTSTIPDGEEELKQLKSGSARLPYEKWSWRRPSSLYSQHPLDVYPPLNNDSTPAHALGKGAVITVKEGEIYPIEIMISEIPGGDYYQILYIEQLDDNGQPLDPNPEYRPLFRTTIDLPEKQPSLPYPKFAPYGPVWRVVRSTSSSGGGSGGGSSGGLIGNRTTPRTARVNENDDDLSL